MKHHRSTLSKQIKQSALCLCAFFSLSSCFAPEESKTPCKDLHKVENIDDLLGQFYANIDSHCLFEMPLTELEDIWGIKIFDLRRIDNQSAADNIVAQRLQYEDEADGFYLLILNDQFLKNDPSEDYFTVFPTNKLIADQKKIWGDSALSQGKLSTLPKADVIEYINILETTLHFPTCRNEEYYKESEFDCWSYQIWFNKKKSKKLPRLKIGALDLKTGTDIRFCKTMLCKI